jgi:hypothetical protein
MEKSKNNTGNAPPLCLLEMPYGYYQFVRFVSIGFAYWLIQLMKKSQKENCFSILPWPFIPTLFKIAFGRTIWNIIDLVVGFHC